MLFCIFCLLAAFLRGVLLHNLFFLALRMKSFLKKGLVSFQNVNFSVIIIK